MHKKQKQEEQADKIEDDPDDFQAAVEELGAMIGTDIKPEEATEVKDQPAKEQSPATDVKEEEAHDAALEQAAATMAEAAKTLSHVNEAGEAHMVDVSDKANSQRVAVAEGFVSYGTRYIGPDPTKHHEKRRCAGRRPHSRYYGSKINQQSYTALSPALPSPVWTLCFSPSHTPKRVCTLAPAQK